MFFLLIFIYCKKGKELFYNDLGMHGVIMFCFVLIDLIKRLKGTKISKIFIPIVLS